MKKLNIKALLIDHGEKIVFGLFAMIVLGILAGGTSWARYAKTPDELKREVENAKSKITSNNPWPKDKEESFKVVNFSDKARLLFSMPPIARYDFSQWLFHPLYKKNEPKREPTFEAVQALIASAAFVPLSVMSEEARQQLAEQSTTGAEDANMPAESSDDSEFGVRATNGGPGGRGRFPGEMPAGPGTLGAAHGAAKPPGMHGAAGQAKPPGGVKSASGGSGKKAMPAAGHAAGPGLLGAGMSGPGMMGSGMMPGMMGSGGMGSGSLGSGVAARGVRVMAVRGVFPIQKQIDNYKNALHVSQDEAADLLEITDFVLERQAAISGPDPWNEKESPWVVVNIDSALEVLSECSDLDFEDPVPTALRDAVITMDLPLNLLGVWKSFATHPLIKNEELTLEQIEEEARLLEKVNEVADGTNLTDPSQPRRKGLAVKQRDFKKIVSEVNSNPDSRGMMDQMMKSMKSAAPRPGADPGGPRGAHGMMGPGMMGAGPGMMGGGMMGPGMRGASALDRLVARRRYLLFRYFDFDVEFGMAYRYRVKLKLRNPNFERSADELGDIEIAKGEERETPWSNISNPDVIRNKSNYFLKDVEREPYAEDKMKPSSRPVALLSMYDWDTTLGTVFSDVLNLTAIGGFIGEDKKSTLIPDLVAGTLEKGEHKFETKDALVDVEGDIEVAPDLHPDLKLTPEKSRANARLGLLEEALVVTSLGELKTLGQSQGQPVSDYDKEALKFWKKQEEREHKAIKSRETAPVATLTTEDDAAKKPRRNPRRRGPQGMSSSMMMPGLPGMPGAGGAEPPTSSKKGSRAGR